MKKQHKPLVAMLGGAFAATVAAAPIANAEQNPFAMTPLAGGYMVAEADTAAKPAEEGTDATMEEAKMKDGKCAAGKCGSSMKKKSETESEKEADADSKVKEGNCSAEMKAKEGSCGSKK